MRDRSPSAHLGRLCSLLVFPGVFYWISNLVPAACILVCRTAGSRGCCSTELRRDRVRSHTRRTAREVSGANEERKKGIVSIRHVRRGLPDRNRHLAQRHAAGMRHCTACIDACDPVMERISEAARPRSATLRQLHRLRDGLPLDPADPCLRSGVTVLVAVSIPAESSYGLTFPSSGPGNVLPECGRTGDRNVYDRARC